MGVAPPVAGVALAFTLALGSVDVVAAQSGASPVPPAPLSENVAGERGWVHAIVGSSPDRNRVILGLWAMHPFEPQFPELDSTRGFGGLYGHWFGATLVNSYDERTFILGIERNWLDVGRGLASAGIGYRVGVVTGYDERLVELARHTPVLPFGGVVVWGRLGPVAVDGYYVYRAITLETSLVF